MSNLYQDAILDAKALRASAMANAKAALEEAFEPKIQEMMRLKLSEEFDEAVEETEGFMKEDDMEDLDAMEDDAVSQVGMEENMDINEAELEEILAQLEELSKDEESMAGHQDEASQVSEEDDAYKGLQEAEEAEEDEEEEESKEGEEEESEEGDEMIGDETKIIDITLGDLKQVLQSVMAGQEGMDLGMDQDVSDAEAADAEAESEISLDEILAELENEGVEETLDTTLETSEYSEEKHASTMQEKKKHQEDEKELEEAKATIDVLRQNLQEVNLLNAKYLYMNKLFKSKSLTESQKVKVINALDRASNVAEVKNTYETLKESFSEPKKTQLKESIGFASQAAGMAPKGNIVDADPFINRWQKLAGIPKRK